MPSGVRKNDFRRAQDDPKRPQESPRWPKMTPEGPQNDPRGAQDGAKSDPEPQDEKGSEPRRSQDRLGPPPWPPKTSPNTSPVIGESEKTNIKVENIHLDIFEKLHAKTSESQWHTGRTRADLPSSAAPPGGPKNEHQIEPCRRGERTKRT